MGFVLTVAASLPGKILCNGTYKKTTSLIISTGTWYRVSSNRSIYLHICTSKATVLCRLYCRSHREIADNTSDFRQTHLTLVIYSLLFPWIIKLCTGISIAQSLDFLCIKYYTFIDWVRGATWVLLDQRTQATVFVKCILHEKQFLYREDPYIVYIVYRSLICQN